MEACRGRLPEVRRDYAGSLRGCWILYAPCHLEVPALRWPAWCRDRPVPGSQIAPGRPVCTLYASEKTHAAVERTLAVRARAVLKLLVQLDRKAA
jgi:predicted ATP-grasp superfamily ATP-dependent carboligase